MGVYANWAKLDPWFTIRMLFHAGHSNSPLSHPILTRQAFFGDAFPLSAVIPFQQHLNRYESFLWPFSMMYPFSSATNILRHIHNEGESGEKVLILTGSQDKLMDKLVTERTVTWYRDAATGRREGARLNFVEGAGHHLQNDVQWKDGAEKLFEFYKGIA